MKNFFEKIRKKEQKQENRKIFDYDKFEDELLAALEEYTKTLLVNKNDIYIMSINYWPEYTTLIGVVANTYSYLNTKANPVDKDYFCYKYCEEEWEIGHWLESLSSVLQDYYNELEQQYASNDELYEEMSGTHRKRIIEVCKNVLEKFKLTETCKSIPNLLLNVYIREYFDNEECISIFKEINGEKESKEYDMYLNGEEIE